MACIVPSDAYKQALSIENQLSMDFLSTALASSFWSWIDISAASAGRVALVTLV